MYATIKLTDLSVPESLAQYDLKWMLMQGENKIATGDFGGKTSGEMVIATNQFINSTTGIEYDLYIWINQTGVSQNGMQGQTFSMKIVADGSAVKLNTLASVILGENNANGTTTAPTFGSTSTDRGLYVQQGDITKSEMGFPTYYFRGNTTSDTINSSYVMNNYVSFGTYQTTDGENTVGAPIIWRVVRINEDGSIRLISENAVLGTIAFNPQGSSFYVNADTEAGESDTIKDIVEDWYDTNIGSNATLNSKVVTSSFCNDMSVSGDSFAAYIRLESETPNPIFICPSGADTVYETLSAKTVYEKVGLITADESIYSGLSFKTEASSYLKDSAVNFWTPTPKNINTTYVHINSLLSGFSTNSSGIPKGRAVINLSPDVLVANSDVPNAGQTAETAYTIQ